MSARIGRRALLGAAAGLLAACTAAEPRARQPTTAPAGSGEPTAATPPTNPSAAPPTTAQATTAPPTAGPPPSAAAGSSRAAIVAKYRSVTPTAFGLTVPGVINRLPGDVVALTFDGCGGPHGSRYDRALIDTLRELRTPATLFLNTRWIEANPAVFRELAADPLFDIANHGTRHLPLSVAGKSAYGIAGTRDVGEVYDEVAGNHATLTTRLGRAPVFFRSGTAHYDDVAVRIVTDLGERVIGFDVNADGGAKFTPAQVSTAMATVKPGSIVIGHLNNPDGGTAEGMAAALPKLLARGLRIGRLREHLGT